MIKYLPKALLFSLGILSYPAFGQAPYTEWQREIKSTYGGEDIRAMIAQPDGSYVMAGSTISSMALDITEASKGDTDFWLVKMNGQTIVWQKRYGGSGADVLTSAKQTPDGGFILWGLTTSPMSGDLSTNPIGKQDIWVVKVDAYGALQWQKRYGHADDDYIGAVHPHKDGGYLIGAAYQYTSTSGNVDSDGWILKVDQQGTVQWEKMLKSIKDPAYNFEQYVHGVEEIAGEYYIYSSSTEMTSKDAGGISVASFNRLTKLQADGTITFDKLLEQGANDNIAGGQLLRTSDNHLMMFTYAGSTAYVVDLLGNTKWKFDAMMNGSGRISMRYAAETPEGGFVITGDTYAAYNSSYTTVNYNNVFKNIHKGGTDGMVLKLSKNGTQEWSRLFGDNSDDRTGAATLMQDGSILLANLYFGYDKSYTLAGFEGNLKLTKLSLAMDTAPPLGPAAPSATTTPCSSTIKWTASQDDREMDGYLLYKGATLVYAGKETTYSFISTYDADYTLMLYALDAQGNKSEGVPLTYTTPSATNAYLGTSRVYRDFTAMNSLVADASGNHIFIAYNTYTTKNNLIKANSEGDFQWKLDVSDSWETFVSNVLMTSDQHYVVTGDSKQASGLVVAANPKGEHDYIIAKLKTDGSVVWKKRFGSTKNDYLMKTIAHPMGGYILAGVTNSPKGGDITEDPRNLLDANARDLWIIYIDEAGNKVWDKRLGGTGTDFFADIFINNEGIIYVGATGSSPIGGDLTATAKGGHDYLLWKLSGSGRILWDKRFGGNGDDEFHSIIETSTRTLILAGHTNTRLASHDVSQPASGTDYNYDYWLISIDEFGTKLWDKRYGGNSDEYLRNVNVKDNHLVLSGESTSAVSGTVTTQNKGGLDIWMVKIDESGQEVWQKSFGSSKNDFIHTTAFSSEGTMLVGARTESYGCDVAATTNNGSWSSNEAWFFKVYETEDTLRPNAPSNPMINELQLKEVELSWTPAKDDRAVRFYRIYQNGFKKADTEADSLIMTDLEQNTEYTFEVSAFDMAGNESEKALVTTRILSVNDVAKVEQPIIYPVPFRESVTFKVPTGTSTPIVQLYDTKGVQMHGQQLNTKEGNYTISQWKSQKSLLPGMYLYRFYHNQKWYSGKIIKE